MKKTIFILGLDTFARKNINQIKLLNARGYVYRVYTSDMRKDSEKYFRLLTPLNFLIVNAGIIKFLRKIFFDLVIHRKKIHHIELYVGGRLSLIYIFLSKLFFLKTILVERGDIDNFNHKNYFHRLSMFACYRFATKIWYKEPYMREELEKFNSDKSRLYFIPNAVELPKHDRKEMVYDFLWINRLVRQRFSNWYINILNDPFFKNTKNILAGVIEPTDDIYVERNQRYAKDHKPPNTEIYGFIEPTQYYLLAKFFVLPSTVVFLNNALLEAMSYGLVPIVTKSNGVELIVDHEENGLIADTSEDSLRKMMLRALNMSDEEYNRFSNKAVKRVKENFSYEILVEKILKVYSSVN